MAPDAPESQRSTRILSIRESERAVVFSRRQALPQACVARAARVYYQRPNEFVTGRNLAVESRDNVGRTVGQMTVPGDPDGSPDVVPNG